MAQKKRRAARKAVWAYAYEIVPPQPEHRMRQIRALLDARQSTSAETRHWKASFVVEEKITHILVVSDSPDQDAGLSDRMAAELKKLHAGFSVTVPLAVAPAGIPPEETE